MLESGKIIMLGRAPFRVDILNQIDGVTFAEVDATKQFVEIDGLEIPVISPEMLLKNKQSTGKVKHQSDAEELRLWLNRD